MRVSIKSVGRAQHPVGTVISLVLPSLPADKEEDSHGFSQLILTPRSNLFYSLPKEAAAGQYHLSLSVIRALAPLLPRGRSYRLLCLAKYLQSQLLIQLVPRL